MSNFFENAVPRNAVYTRNILRNVYIWMTLALSITGVVAFVLGQNTAFAEQFLGTPLYYVLLVGSVIMVFALSGFIMKMNPMVATLVFAAYSVLVGVIIAPIFAVYTATSIATTFFITAGLFGTMSVFAITTKRDLSSWGNFLMMAVIGLFIAGLVNMFLHSSVMGYIISFIGVLVFTALTAYDTQKIKRMSDSKGDNIVEADFIRLSILGALTLYLDFVNIFLYLLRFFGSSRN